MQPPSYPRPFGSYVLLERLGQGGMSEVDLARRAVDQAGFVRFLVIKRIHADRSGEDEFVRMFQDEARINAELQHENIASVYDFGQEGDQFFMAMEYVPGCDLRHVQRALARRREPFPLRMAMRILADVLSALDYAHHRVDTYGRSMNIVHRDVNPRNIMLSVRGEVKLIDFGVAKADNRAEHTVGHSLKGKFAYMAPEQIDGARGVDGRADLFAVGIVLHELLTGASPFAGLTEVQTMHRILAGKLPPVESRPGRPVPHELLEVYEKAIATDADQRWQSAGAMRRALVDAAAAVGGMASRGDLATFLLTVDPGLGAMAARLEEWREHSHSQRVPVGAVPARTAPPADETSASGTLAGGAPTTAGTTAGTIGVAAAGAGIGAVVAVVALLGLGAGAWYLLQPPAGDAPAGQVRADARPDAPPSRTRAADTPEAPAEPPAADTPAPTGSAPSDAAPPRQGSSGTAAAPAPAAAAPPGEEAGTGSTTAAGEAPREQAPAEEAPAGEGTAEEAPAGEGTAEEGTAEEAPAQEAPAQDAPAEEAPAPDAPAATTAGAPEQPTTSTGGPTGRLNVTSRPTGLELWVDGKLVGRTPVRAIELPGGTHRLEVRDPATGRSWEQAVEVEPGRGKMVVLGEER